MGGGDGSSRRRALACSVLRFFPTLLLLLPLPGVQRVNSLNSSTFHIKSSDFHCAHRMIPIIQWGWGHMCLHACMCLYTCVTRACTCTHTLTHTHTPYIVPLQSRPKERLIFNFCKHLAKITTRTIRRISCAKALSSPHPIDWSYTQKKKQSYRRTHIKQRKKASCPTVNINRLIKQGGGGGDNNA